tara:strand:- start:5579 stop:7747 length:2169 start_codon:yes stop_codon:yes gene_type:complete
MKFKINTNIIFLIMVCSIFFACAGGPASQQKKSIAFQNNLNSVIPPEWVLGKEHPSFPMVNYVVGRGKSRESSVSAAENARMDLAKTIKVSIRSKILDYSTNGFTQVESVIKSEVDAVLEGVEIRDGWFDETTKNYYAYAVMNREMASQSIKNRMKLLAERLNWLLDDGDGAMRKNNIVSALSSYSSGYIDASNLQSLKAMLNVIGRRLEENSKEFDAPKKLTFESKAKNIVNNISIMDISGNKQKVKVSSLPAEPLILKLFLHKGSSMIPLKGVPVKFKYINGDGFLDEEVLTDGRGIAQSVVRKIISYNKRNHRISAGIDLKKIVEGRNKSSSQEFLGRIKNIKTEFIINIEKTKFSSTQSGLLRQEILHLAKQIIHNINPNSNHVLGIFNFRDFYAGKSTSTLSKVIREELEETLSMVDGLTVREMDYRNHQNSNKNKIALDNYLDVYVVGGYRLVGDSIEIRARLLEAVTNNILGSGKVVVRKQDIGSSNIQFVENDKSFLSQDNKNESYDELKEILVDLKSKDPSFKLKLSTDKIEYRVGEKLNFFIETSMSCYLTLLDFSPDGIITVLFPNGNQKNNKILPGKIHKIPPNIPSEKSKAFSLMIQEPSGLDRIKAFCHLEEPSPLKLSINNRMDYHTIRPDTTQGNNDLKRLIEEFIANNPNKWAEAYNEIYIFDKGVTYMRGKKSIPIIEKPDKPKDMIGTFGNELPAPQSQGVLK